jgi:hypothetical protein
MNATRRTLEATREIASALLEIEHSVHLKRTIHNRFFRVVFTNSIIVLPNPFRLPYFDRVAGSPRTPLRERYALGPSPSAKGG